MNRRWGNNRKPSVDTLEYQKTFRSKYESFPKIFFSLPSWTLLLPFPFSLSYYPSFLLFIPFSFLPLSFLSFSLLFFLLYPSFLGRKLVNRVSIISIFFNNILWWLFYILMFENHWFRMKLLYDYLFFHFPKENKVQEVSMFQFLNVWELLLCGLKKFTANLNIIF